MKKIKISESKRRTSRSIRTDEGLFGKGTSSFQEFVGKALIMSEMEDNEIIEMQDDGSFFMVYADKKTFDPGDSDITFGQAKALVEWYNSRIHKIVVKYRPESEYS